MTDPNAVHVEKEVRSMRRMLACCFWAVFGPILIVGITFVLFWISQMIAD